jgi:hypothetical protein
MYNIRQELAGRRVTELAQVLHSRPRGDTKQGIVRVPVVFVNAYLVDVEPDEPGRGWVLVDSGLPALGAAAIARGRSAARRSMLRRAALQSPADGRYVRQPARADQRGVVSPPPPVADPIGGAIRGGAIAAAATAVVMTVSRARRRPRRRLAAR